MRDHGDSAHDDEAHLRSFERLHDRFKAGQFHSTNIFLPCVSRCDCGADFENVRRLAISRD